MSLREKEHEESVIDNKDKKKKGKGLLTRIWNVIFRIRGDDFEKRLEYISKEESTVRSRMKQRSITRKKLIRNLIAFSVFFEVIAVSYAVMTTKDEELDWKIRSFRVLPMFCIPVVAFLAYSSIVSFTRMFDRRDQSILEKLQEELVGKINELKERTNYYTTQQLIQRYDPDPAAKAAAATVLASKLGADSGFKVFLGDESQLDLSTGKKSPDREVKQHSQGLKNRRQNSAGAAPMNHSDNDESNHPGTSERIASQQMVVEHYNPQGHSGHDGSWISRIAALLVAEDPTQSYALICGNCHMRNGLARKEDFPHMIYYCPHCQALNKPKHSLIAPAGSLNPMESEVVNNSSSSSERGNSPIPLGNISEIAETTESRTVD